MPMLPDDPNDMTQHNIGGSNYGFSAVRIDSLKATAYTLVGVAPDVSGSTAGYRVAEEACLAEIVKACRHSPRKDNLMMRLADFDHNIREIHGFKPLMQCNPDDYKGCLRAGGSTALYDASYNAVEAVTTYGAELTKNEYDVNAIVFVLTDGCDNASTLTAAKVKEAVERAVSGESVESIVTVLIGVNVTDPGIAQILSDFATAAGFTQFVNIGEATDKKLAKLAEFVSKSISSQSQALGTGGPSKALTF